MKLDEQMVLIAVAHGATPRIALRHLHYRRLRYICEKWARKGWYDYGVSYDRGWLTEEGKRVAAELEAKRYE